MSVLKIRPWQWLALSVVLGLGLGQLAGWYGRYVAPDYGETINGDRDFEAALARDVPLADGGHVRAFHDLTVYPDEIAGDGGGTRPVHVVAGEFVAPERPDPATGRVVARLERRAYVAAVPYRSITTGREFPTVRAYLDTLAPLGVGYRYAWWRDPRWRTPFWLGAAVLVVGVLWPAALNLIAYGSLRRPPEPKADLPAPRPAAAPAPVPVPQDDAALAAMEDEMLAWLEQDAASGAAAAPKPAAAASTPAAPRKFETTPVGPAPVGPNGEPHSYGAGPEDFYPTERKSPPRPRP